VVCVTAALFASAPDGLPARFFFAMITGVILTGPGLRFKKAAGIPLLVLSLAALVFGVKAFSGWTSAGKTTPAAAVLVLSLEENAAALSFTPQEAKETIIRASLRSGTGLGVKTGILRVPAAYLIFGAIPLYRIQAVCAPGEDYPVPLPEPSGWEKALLSLPGIRVETRETPLPPLSIFASYEILFDPAAENILISEKP
jgi:hypothetical protein